MTEFGVFDLFRFDSFIVHFSFVRFLSPRGRSVHDEAFRRSVGTSMGWVALSACRFLMRRIAC
ncbi:MAG: hypothetical protein OXC82_02820 [Rhodobacteraceae bacterium]|nr:hypothetical protein [Paracoccaceae bacterium]